MTMSQTTTHLRSSLLSLPAEILPLISAHLEYPDILSLQLVHPHFYYSPLLSTDNDAGIRSRVAWLCAIGSFAPLEGLLQQRPKDRRYTKLGLPSLNGLFSWQKSFSISIWNLIDPQRYHFRTSDVSRLCMRLRTNREFLSNGQVQRMLRLRLDHDICGEPRKGCVVIPGTLCSGPRRRFPSETKGKQLASSANSSRDCTVWYRMRILAHDLGALMQGRSWEGRSFGLLGGWDILYLILIAVGLLLPWSLMVQGFVRLMVGVEIPAHTAGLVVTCLGLILGKSVLKQSRGCSVARW